MSSKGINWEKKPELLEWKSIAIEKQRFYYEFFRNRRWEIYEEPEYSYLKLKIGYALLGPPVDVKDNVVDNFYNSSQKKRIEDVFKTMRKINKEKMVVMGFLFFISMIDNKYTEFPVFRVLKRTQEDGTEICCFVDSFGYGYKNWNKFLNSNIIPSCIYCYPKDGFYTCNESGDLELDFSYCPQSYSIITGVVSAVGTVGNAACTVGGAPFNLLPVSRDTQQDLLPIPLNSVIKGVIGINKNYWIPVTSASGSAELYAVHCTQKLAESSQTTQKIPLIVLETLEKGFINITWYAVLNQISNIIQHSNKTTYMHVAQVLTAALFFCHSVLSTDVIKKIIKEIRTEENNQALHALEHGKRIAMQNSIALTEKNPSNPITKELKFIDDRNELAKEIIEETFKTHFIIPDNEGNYFTLGNLIEKVVNSMDSQKYAAIITNYCLELESTIRNCRNCIQVMENHGKCIGIFNRQFNADKEEDTTNKIEYNENQIRQMCINSDVNETKTSIKNNVTPIIVKENNEPNSTPLKNTSTIGGTNHDTHTPITSRNSIEKKINSDWLISAIFNTLASPLVTPMQKLEREKEKGLGKKYSAETNCSPGTPRRGQQINETQKKDILRKILQANTQNIMNETSNMENTMKSLQTDSQVITTESPTKEIVIKALQTNKKQINTKLTQKKNITKIADHKITTESPMKENVIQTNRQEIANKIYENRHKSYISNNNLEEFKITNVLDQNLNTPEKKKHWKNILEHINNQNEESDNKNNSGGLLNESTNGNNLSVADNKREEMGSKFNKRDDQNETMISSKRKDSCGEMTLLDDLENLSLKSTSITVARKRNPKELLDPLTYFKELVQGSLNNAEPLECSSESDNSWQFVLPAEVQGVKLVKINIKERTEEEEVITISYY